MKCCMSHYKDEHGGVTRFWYPQCIGGAVNGPSGCTCRPEADWNLYEKAKYNEHVRQLRKEISDGQSEIVNLNRIIAHLIRSKPNQRKLNKLADEVMRLQSQLEIHTSNAVKIPPVPTATDQRSGSSPDRS